MRSFLQELKFSPGLIALPLNHHFVPRYYLNRFVRSKASLVTGCVLDLGCGSSPYRKYFQYEHYIGVDIENPGHSHELEEIDVYYDGRTLPIADNCIDSAISFEVLEHVLDKDNFLAEIYRVLCAPSATM